jgi:hypothetical protein
MKTKLVLITALLFALAQTLQAQTADGYVSQGRAFLAATNLTAANNSFANAVALSPNHQAANVFYAATRLLVLPSQPAGSNFLNRLGVPIAGRDIYNWKALLPKDTNGVPLAPAGVNANESTAMLRTNIFPALVAAEANLAKVTDTNFTLSLTSNETRTVSVTIDYGDVLLLRAMLHAGEFFAYTTYACNLDAELAAIRSLYTNEELSIERLLMDYPNLLTFTTTNELEAAKLAFQNGADLYLQASEFIRNRSTNVTRLFNYDAGKAQDEEKFRMTLTDLKNSLNGAVPLAVDTNYTVFFSAPFSDAQPLRSFLPDFRGNRFVLGTLPDPTFGGLIYGITRPNADAFLAEHLLSVPTIAPGSSAVGAQFQFPINVAKGQGYVVQVSTNLLNWADYAAFVSLGGQYAFTDPNAYGFPRRFYRVEDRTGNMPPPANDDFANRALISGMNVPVTSYTDSATYETDEFPGGDGHTIWWTWTSSVSADVAVLATGGSGWWQVAVFTGTSVDGLVQVDNAYGPITTFAQAGTTYQIAVDTSGQDGAVKLVITRPPVLTVTSPPDGAVFSAPANILVSGSASDPDGQIRRVTVSAWPSQISFESTNDSFSFWWTNVPNGNYYLSFSATDDVGAQTSVSRSIRVTPPNDNFTNATPISGAPLTVTGSNAGADKEPGEPNDLYGGGASVWWSWTAPSNGIFTISARLLARTGKDSYPLLRIYTGTSVSNLTALASNTPFYPAPAQVTFTAWAGATYQIAVDGRYNNRVDNYGNITLKVVPTQPPLVSIVSPTDGSVLVGPTNITITATASDPDGSVSRVDFYCYETLIGSATNSPYSMVWSNVGAGSYSLTAKATDNTGAFTYSAPVNITVTPP